MIKTAFSLFAASTVSFSAYANEIREIFVCSSTNAGREITLVVQETSAPDLEMKVYRSTYGHTSPPELFTVSNHPATRGPIVVFKDNHERTLLVVNMLSREANGEIRGQFSDPVSETDYKVLCK